MIDSFLLDSEDQQLIHTLATSQELIAHSRIVGDVPVRRRRRAAITCALGVDHLTRDARGSISLLLDNDYTLSLVAESLREQACDQALAAWLGALAWGDYLPSPHRLGPHGLPWTRGCAALGAAMETWLGVNGPWRRGARLALDGEATLSLVADRKGGIAAEPLIEGHQSVLELAVPILEEDLVALAEREAVEGLVPDSLSALDLSDQRRTHVELQRRRRAAAVVALGAVGDEAWGVAWAVARGSELEALEALDAAKAGFDTPGCWALSMARALLGVDGMGRPDWLEYEPGAAFSRTAVLCLMAATEIHAGMIGPYRYTCSLDVGEDPTFGDDVLEALVHAPASDCHRGIRPHRGR